MRTLAVIVLFLASTLPVLAQVNTDQNLAIQFYQNGEYAKAAEIFEKLYDKNPQDFYYRYLFNSWVYTKEYDKLEKVVKRNIKKNPQNLTFLVDLGYLYKQEGNVAGGEAEYDKALKALPADERMVRELANAFLAYGENEIAVQSYLTGRKLLTGSSGNPLFAFDLADLYIRLNKKTEAVESYLDYIKFNPQDVQNVQNRFQDLIQEDVWYDALQMQLLARIQKGGDQIYSEMLIWEYIQRNNYRAAFIQVKALDKRLKETGHRVIVLARAANGSGDYDAAIDAYQYIIEKGAVSPLYQIAKQEILIARKAKITTGFNYTDADLNALLIGYDAFLTEFGINKQTVQVVMDKAQLKAFYFHQIDSAIAIVNAIINIPALEKMFKNQAKLELGDYYLLKGDVWESTLLYSQVDKEMKDEPLGELARFKNAKLSYYMADFDWAQAQLNILKGATTHLISNDAIALAVFIMDNMGLDTTLYPMQKYAEAELLVFQNDFDAAILKLDSISNIFPQHTLADDIIMMRAKIALKKKDYAKGAEYLEAIRTRFAEDLLGDDATFMLAELYETVLNDKNKAMELYQDLLVTYKNSVLVIEARKRFRKLRGDEL
ncbi:tetratricopeptide repeat protein [soil metagenome]